MTFKIHPSIQSSPVIASATSRAAGTCPDLPVIDAEAVGSHHTGPWGLVSPWGIKYYSSLEDAVAVAEGALHGGMKKGWTITVKCVDSWVYVHRFNSRGTLTSGAVILPAADRAETGPIPHCDCCECTWCASA